MPPTHPTAGLRRRTTTLTRAVGDETIVYDRRDDQVHLLRGSVSTAWSSIGQEPGPRQASPVDAADVDELIRLDLVEPTTGLSRRRLLQRGAVLAGAAAALPLIESMTSPAAAATCSAPSPLAQNLLVQFTNLTALASASQNASLPAAPTFYCGGTTYPPSAGMSADNTIGSFSFAFSPLAADMCHTGSGSGPTVPGTTPAYSLCFKNAGTTLAPYYQFVDPVNGFGDFIGYTGTGSALFITPDTAHNVGIRYNRQCTGSRSVVVTLTATLKNTSTSAVLLGFDNATPTSITGVTSASGGLYSLAGGATTAITATATLTPTGTYFQVFAETTANAAQQIQVTAFSVTE